MTTSADPLHCIIPPYMLRSIAERGTAAQRAQALSNFTASAQLAGQQSALNGAPTMAQAVAAAGKERVVYDAKGKTTLPGTKVRAEGSRTGDVASTRPTTARRDLRALPQGVTTATRSTTRACR